MDQRGGDPEGRRVSRRRAQRLAEAGRVARMLQVLLEAAEFDATSCTRLIAEIAERERVELERSYGRIQPRRRFKRGSPQPLVDRRGRNLLFVDEAGRSDDLTEPWFALGAVAISIAEALAYRRRADRLKQRFFGRTDLTFHEPMMRIADGPYYFDGEAARVREFHEAVNGLIAGTDFVAFGAAIRKTAFHQFIDSGSDLYLPGDVYAVAIQMLLERYVDYLALSAPDQPLGRVTFESQGALEDAHHQRDYVGVLIDGTQWIAGTAFRQWLETGVRFTPKQGSEPMELADMLSRDLYEWIRADCVGSPGRWDIFSAKMYCRGDKRLGTFGVKVFPDSDIRDRIEAHRDRSGASTN